MGLTKKQLGTKFGLDEKVVSKLIEKFDILPLIEKQRNAYTYSLEDFEKFTNPNIPTEDLINQSFDLLKSYYENNLPLPFGVKGLIGELICLQQLLSNLKDLKIFFLGGAYPQYDIICNGKKIQVKTKFFEPFKWDRQVLALTQCPSTSNKSIENFDFLILVEIFHTNWKIDKSLSRAFIFSHDEFKEFSSEKGCWTKDAVTIWCPHKPFSSTLKKTMESKNRKGDDVLLHYNQPKYHSLFKNSENNWKKLNRLE